MLLRLLTARGNIFMKWGYYQPPCEMGFYVLLCIQGKMVSRGMQYSAVVTQSIFYRILTKYSP